MYWEVKPSFLVDISPQLERKLAAINCFASQFAGDLRDITELYPAWGKLIDRITTQCKYFGHLMGVEYAEPFVVKEVDGRRRYRELPVASLSAERPSNVLCKKMLKAESNARSVSQRP